MHDDQRAEPRRIIEQISQMGFARAGERKQVTILFADLKGSLEFIADRDPEEARALLDPVLEHMIEAVRRYDGTVNQVMGDGIMALFGAPIAQENHALCACYSALAMQASLAKQEGREMDASLRIRIGINSGEVVVRAISNDLHMDYSAIGQSTHLAARMEQMAEPGTTLLTASTLSLVKGYMDCESLGLQNIKGYATPVEVFRLIDILPMPSKLHRELRRGLSPFINREREIAQLESALSLAAAGHGSAIIIMGDGGIGKSRLVWELSRYRASDWSTLEVEVFSYGAKTSMQPVIQLLRAALDIDDSVTVDGDFLAEWLTSQGNDEPLREHALQALLCAAPSDTWRQLEPREQRERLFEVGRWVLRRVGEIRPLFIVAEQLDNADDDSLAFFGTLIEEIADTRILLLTTVRDITTLPWRQDCYTVIPLAPLSEKNARVLSEALLGRAVGASTLGETLIKYSGGNPLFMEESVRSLVESEMLQGSPGAYRCEGVCDVVKPPPSVQAILASRIDKLNPEDKQLLQIAAVIGSEVPFDVLRAVAGLQENRLHQGLLHLQNAGFLEQKTLIPRLLYAFRHALAHDVASSLLLREQRYKLHRDIATWYEQTYADDLAPLFAQLAFHWEAAGMPTRAADYLEREAVRIFSLGLAPRSVVTGLRAAELLGVTLPTDPDKIRSQISAEMQTIGETLAGRRPEELLDLPYLDSTPEERVLQLLLRIAPLAFQTQKVELYALISLTALRLTLQSGQGVHAASVYSLYSVVHLALTGDSVGANAWSKLALEVDRRRDNAKFSEVAFVHCWFHNHWTQPLRSSLEQAHAAAEAGFEQGNILFACFNLSAYVIYQTAAGFPLAEVMQTARGHLKRNNRQVINASFHLVNELQYAKALAGHTVDQLSMSDHEYDEKRDVAWVCETELGNQIGYYLVTRLKLHAWFGDWAGALQWAKRAEPLLPVFRGQTAEIELRQFSALAVLSLALDRPHIDRAEATEAIESTDAVAAMFRSWADSCAENFTHKLLLIEALRAAVKGDDAVADTAFAEAAACAEAAAFTQDVALACEHRARWLRRLGDVDAEVQAMNAAIDAYTRWGAYAKVAQLQTQIPLKA